MAKKKANSTTKKKAAKKPALKVHRSKVSAQPKAIWSGALTPVQWNMLASAWDQVSFSTTAALDVMAVTEFLTKVTRHPTFNTELELEQKARKR